MSVAFSLAVVLLFVSFSRPRSGALLLANSGRNMLSLGGLVESAVRAQMLTAEAQAALQMDSEPDASSHTVDSDSANPSQTGSDDANRSPSSRANNKRPPVSSNIAGSTMTEQDRLESQAVCTQIQRTRQVPATVCFWPSVGGSSSGMAWRRAFLQGGFLSTCPAAAFIQSDTIIPDRFPLDLCCEYRRCNMIPGLSRVANPLDLATVLHKHAAHFDAAVSEVRFIDYDPEFDSSSLALQDTQDSDLFFPFSYDLTNGQYCLKAIQAMAHWYTRTVGPLPDTYSSKPERRQPASGAEEANNNPELDDDLVEEFSLSPWVLKTAKVANHLRFAKLGVGILTTTAIADAMVRARELGIDVMKAFDNVYRKPASVVNQAFDACQQIVPARSVLQSRVFPPMLVQGKKIDLRFFVYIASLSPYVVYMHEYFLVRFAAENYEESSTNASVHLTSGSGWGRKSVRSSWRLGAGGAATGPGANDDIRVPPAMAWTASQLRRHWNGAGGRRDPNAPEPGWIDDKLYPQVGKIVKTVFNLMKHKIMPWTSDQNQGHISSFHELVGVDIIVDHNHKPWLVDIHRRPFLDRRRYKASPNIDRAHRQIMRQVISLQHELLKLQARNELADATSMAAHTQFHAVIDETADFIDDTSQTANGNSQKSEL